MATSSSTHRQNAASPPSSESFESLARRKAAAEVLQSYEKLSWWSMQRCESLHQTRLHFENIFAGFTPTDEEANVRWKTDNISKPLDATRDNKSKGKVSVGRAPTGNVANQGEGDVEPGSSNVVSSKKRKALNEQISQT